MNLSLLLLIGIVAASSTSTSTVVVGAFAFTQPFQTPAPSSMAMSTANRGHPTATTTYRRNTATAAAAAASTRSTSTPRAASSAPDATALRMSKGSDTTAAAASAAAAAVVVPGIGEEGCRLPSPSGVNTWPEPQQAALVVAIFVALGVSTALFDSLLSSLTTHYGGTEFFHAFRQTWPVVLGLVFALAGVTHFAVPREYENIYPPSGTWGVWYLPGSKKFHVTWTGIAELVGGVGLFLGGITDYLGVPSTGVVGLASNYCALGLFGLTWAVTPANIYMFTHGARLPMDPDGPDVPMTFHVVRFLMQVVLLGLLWQLGGASVVVGSAAGVQ